jgi:hypothetical protein
VIAGHHGRFAHPNARNQPLDPRPTSFWIVSL